MSGQFFAGETAEESAQRVWTPLRREHIGCLAGFNVETEDHALQTPESVASTVAETLHSIREVGQFGIKYAVPDDVANGDTRCWARIKLTALLTDSEALRRASDVIVEKRQDKSTPFPGVVADGDFENMFGPSVSSTVSRMTDSQQLSL